jgi:Cytochrome P450
MSVYPSPFGEVKRTGGNLNSCRPFSVSKSTQDHMRLTLLSVTAAVVAAAAFHYLRSRKHTGCPRSALTASHEAEAAPEGAGLSQVPGPACSDPEHGNLKDVAVAGSLHQYLMRLHAEYGPIAAFWWGPQRVVSLASVDLWKSISALFDRPRSLFAFLEPLIGQHSLQLANGSDGKSRRKLYVEPAFSRDSLKAMFTIFQSVTQATVARWESHGVGTLDNPLNLQEEMTAIALESIAKSALGSSLSQEDVDVRVICLMVICP